MVGIVVVEAGAKRVEREKERRMIVKVKVKDA